MGDKWRARPASDRTDDWSFWYVTDDQPPDRNKTHEALAAIFGESPLRGALPFLPRESAEILAAKMNELPGASHG
jgi:hypothetical protein